MQRTTSTRSAALAAAVASLLLTAACGNVSVTTKTDATPSEAPSEEPAAAAPDTSAGEGEWLLGMTTAGGADGETSTTVYVSYNPSTGVASAHKMPPVKAASTAPEQAGLLVSGDRQWAIPDTGVSNAEQKSGKLKVYSLTGTGTTVVDIRARSGKGDVDPIGWAFDPTSDDTLRVVDTKSRVWAVNVSGGKAKLANTLPSGKWIFTNGFDRNTGEPWVESIDSDETQPPGYGPADTAPISRDGGTVLPAGSPGLAALPANPCRLGAGFTDAAGVTWLFCADAPTVATHYLPKSSTGWTAYGKASTPVAPVAAGFPLVLPPAE